MSATIKHITVANNQEAVAAVAKATADPGNEYHIEAGGGLDLSSLTSLPANAKLAAGGGLDLSSLTSPTKHQENNPCARGMARAVLVAAFAAKGYSIADGILSKIVHTRGPVSRVIVCGKTEISYLVTDGDAWSHGKTLAEARDGLLFKIGKRDTSEFKKWTLDLVVSKRDAIRAYRTITGACEGGVRSWMEKRKTPETISVQEIINITEGAYGSGAFAKFFNAPVLAEEK